MRPVATTMSRMQGAVYRLTAVACIATALSGCTSGLGGGSAPEKSVVVPSVSLDGLYRIVEDGTGTLNGARVDFLAKSDTQWAFRTTCDTNGCYAVGAKFDPEHPSAQPNGFKVADYVDGKWSVISLAEQAPCPRDTGETYKGDRWDIWDIEPAPDNNVKLNVTVAGTNDCNFINEFSPAITRVGDAPKDFPWPQPADVPKRLASFPATAFRGKYTVDYAVANTGQSQSTEHMDVKTYCLRSEDRCVTTTVNVDPRDPGTQYGLQVFKYEYGKYRFDQTLGKKPCRDNLEGIASKTVILPLPPAPVPDPLTTLTGQAAVTFTGDCQGTDAYNVAFSRTGD